MRDFDYGDATDFLDDFFRGTEHVVEIRALPNERSGGAKPLFGGDDALKQVHCQTWDKLGWGVFFGCCTRIKGRPTGTRADLAELVALWCDIDCYKNGFSKEEVIKALKNCPIPPTIIVDSGGGIHAYWLLREPMDARQSETGHDAVKEEVDAVLKQLSGVFAGDRNVCEIARVMRLVGTHNTKDGELRPVTLVDASGPRWEFADLQNTLDWLGPILRTPEAAEEPFERPRADNPFSEFAQRFAFKAPIDVRQRLDAMSHEADGENSIHQTQLQVSASLVRQGLDDDEIVNLILDATHCAAGLAGERWNWKREEANLHRMIADWRKKLAREAPPPRQPATVVQLRGGGPNPAADAASDAEPEDVPKLAGFPLNDLGNAMRLITQHGTALRYVVGMGWHVWDDRRYRYDPATVAARRLAHETVRTMLVQSFDMPARNKDHADHKKVLIKFAISSGNANKVVAMLSQAEPHLDLVADDLDRDPMLLNCINGTVEQRVDNLRPHTQEDLLTKICGTIYDPTAACPIWEKFVLDIFDGDEELVAFVQRALGYSLTGLTTEQVVFILHGSGSNGKSVLLETVAAILGDYAQQCPSETFISQEKGSRIPSDIARLAGARFVSVVETEHERNLAEGLVKQATGGDRMAARFLHKEWFEFTPKFKLWLATNHKPRIRGSDYAIWRRILLLPFNVTFVDADKLVEGRKVKDPDLKNKLAAEFPGILAWMIRGCMAWQRGGLRPPEAVIAATENYQDSQDNVSAFIRDNCHLSRGLDCPAGILYAGYENWCDDNDEDAIPQRAFGRNLDERGHHPGPRTNKARPRKGIDIKQEYREDAAKRQAIDKVGKGAGQ